MAHRTSIDGPVVPIDKDEALFLALEHDAEGASQDDDEDDDDDDPFEAHLDETSDKHDLEEIARKRLIQSGRAKALCPIRTRFLPDYEEQRVYDPNKLRIRRFSGSEEASVKKETSLSTIASAASRTNHPAVRAARRAKRALRQIAKRGKAEIKHVKAAAVEFSKTALTDMKDGGDGADRILSEIVGSAYHADPDDLAAFGVAGAQLRLVLQNRAFDHLKSRTGLDSGECPFIEMQSQGRYFCRAHDQGLEITDKELEKLIAEPRFQNLRTKGISREEAMAMMNAEGGNPDDKDDKHRSDGTSHKGTVSMQTVEDVWWSNCKGQAAIRRKPEEHEAVYDFADNRISMPRYTCGESAGQLVTVKPDLHHHGLVGEVTMYTRAPKRAKALHVATRLDQMTDVVTLEKGVDEQNKCDHGLSRHAHLTTRSLPPSTKSWLEWRDAQLAKRRAAYELALATGIAARVGPQDMKKDDDFHSQSSGEDMEAVFQAESARTGGSQSARGGKETARSDGTADPQSVRRGRRQGIDVAAMVTDDARWDARPPPNQDELKSVLQKCANMGGHQGHAPMSFVAIESQAVEEQDRSARGRLSARASQKAGDSARKNIGGISEKKDEIGYVAVDMEDPFADELREKVWTLIAVKGEEQLDVVFAVALEGGLDKEILLPEEEQLDAEAFWDEIFRPVAMTWMDQIKEVFGFGP